MRLVEKRKEANKMMIQHDYTCEMLCHINYGNVHTYELIQNDKMIKKMKNVISIVKKNIEKNTTTI